MERPKAGGSGEGLGGQLEGDRRLSGNLLRHGEQDFEKGRSVNVKKQDLIII